MIKKFIEKIKFFFIKKKAVPAPQPEAPTGRELFMRVHHGTTLTGDGSRSNPLDAVFAGGLTTVAHDSTLTGTGEVGNELKVAVPFPESEYLVKNLVAGSNITLVNSSKKWTINSTATGGISTVSHWPELYGDGTSSNPLGLSDVGYFKDMSVFSNGMVKWEFNGDERGYSELNLRASDGVVARIVVSSDASSPFPDGAALFAAMGQPLGGGWTSTRIMGSKDELDEVYYVPSIADFDKNYFEYPSASNGWRMRIQDTGGGTVDHNNTLTGDGKNTQLAVTNLILTEDIEYTKTYTEWWWCGKKNKAAIKITPINVDAYIEIRAGDTSQNSNRSQITVAGVKNDTEAGVTRMLCNYNTVKYDNFVPALGDFSPDHFKVNTTLNKIVTREMSSATQFAGSTIKVGKSVQLLFDEAAGNGPSIGSQFIGAYYTCAGVGIGTAFAVLQITGGVSQTSNLIEDPVEIYVSAIGGNVTDVYVTINWIEPL